MSWYTTHTVYKYIFEDGILQKGKYELSYIEILSMVLLYYINENIFMLHRCTCTFIYLCKFC